MHRDPGEWRHGEGISPSVLSKERQGGRRCLFIISVGAGKFWVCDGFCPNFPKLVWKVFWVTFANKLSSTKIMKTSFGCNLQKNVFTCFCANLGHHFLKPNNFGRYFYPDFQDFCPDFQQTKLFGVSLKPLQSTSNTTAFHNSIIGHFMVYHDRLETNLLQLYRHPDNSEWFSIISVIIFEVNTVDEQKQT